MHNASGLPATSTGICRRKEKMVIIHMEDSMRLLSLLVALSFLCISSATSQISREIHKTLPLKSDGRLVIDTYKGSITVRTHDKPQVEVDVRIESDDSNSREAEMDVKDTEIDIDGSDAEVTLHTSYKDLERERHTGFWNNIFHSFEFSNSLPLVHYTIKMPRTAELRIKDYKSRTRIDDLRSDLKFTTYKGEAEINNLLGGIELETYKGTVHISFSHLSSDSRIETQKGSITIAVPKGDKYDLLTNFGRRVNFSTDFDVQRIERNKKHNHYDYQANIHGGGPRLRLTSEKGEMRLVEK